MIKIPPCALTISAWNFLAVGMQNGGSSNAIYAVTGVSSLSGSNIVATTETLGLASDMTAGIAFAFTVAHNGT